MKDKARLASPQANRPSPPELTSTRHQGSSHPQQRRGWSLKTKATAWALAVSMLPVLAVGAATYYLGSQSITKQITQARQAGTTGLEETERALQRQLTPLLVGTGAIAVLAGAIAAVLANRAIRPILSATATSNTMVSRLRREEVSTWARVTGKDELVALETNLGLIEEKLPELLWKQEAEAERFELLLNITRRIRESLSEEDVLRTTVEEVRKAFRTDRVTIFRFDANWDGTFVEESVASGWPKMLWATIHDPCFEERYVEQYRNGRVRVIDNIYQAGLNDCHIGLLERFAVKANLIAPIITNNQLFGLLIAHQCAGPRLWQQSETDLFAQLATQVGFALDYARLLERLDTKAAQAQLFIDLTRRIRQSLIEEDILKITVEEVRRALITDRVLVYSFDPDWYGTVVAESVVPGFPRALRAKIKDPCFAEGYVDKYQDGRVQATNNIYEAGLTDCHLNQLKPFAVQANLVAPILKDDKLFGLLIAHQCSGPRAWQQLEINLFAQVAVQVGFALDHARLLDQVEQAYQAAEATSREQRQQKEVLQHRVSELLKDSKAAIATLSTEALSQMESVKAAYNQIQATTDSTQRMTTTAQQAELQTQQTSQTVQAGREIISQAVDGISAIQESFLEAAEKVKRLDHPSQKLSEVVSLVSNIVSQIKFQAINGSLQAARSGETGQEFAAIAEKVQSLAQQLDAGIAEIKPLIAETQAGIHQVAAAIKTGTEPVIAETRLIEEAQQRLNQIAAASAQMHTLMEELGQAATGQAQTSTSASQSVLEVASFASHTSEQSLAVAESFTKLAATAQEL